MIPKLLWVALLFNLTSLASLYAAPSGPLPFTGVNLAGGEFWMPGKPKEGVQPNYGVNYSYPTEEEIQYFSGKGMNIFRYQFLWETLQPTVTTPLNKADLTRLKASVRFATSRNLVVLL